MNKVIDISEYQSGADLEAAYADGIGGFLFRLGFGNDETGQDDKAFEDFVSQAERLKAPWGAYLFSYAVNDGDIGSEIAHALRLLNGRKPELGVWWDLEQSDYKDENGFRDLEQADSVRRWAEEFIEAMQDNGMAGGLYCDLNHLRNIDMSSIEHIWAAGYFDDPDFDSPPYVCDLWQYSSSSDIKGIAGNVDISVVYADWINDVIDGKGDNGSSDDGGKNAEFDGGDITEMKMNKEQLKYEINRHALALFGREIGDADTYVELLSTGQIDWYEFNRRLQESEEGVRRWIRFSLFYDILGRTAAPEEIDTWYARYGGDKAGMIKSFMEENMVEFDGGDVMKMSMDKEQLKYEINRHALSLLGREVGDADKYVEFLSTGQIDWYEFNKRLQESEEGVKRWIRYTLFIDILGREPSSEETDFWYEKYLSGKVDRAVMVKRFAEDYEKFRKETAD